MGRAPEGDKERVRTCRGLGEEAMCWRAMDILQNDVESWRALCSRDDLMETGMGDTYNVSEESVETKSALWENDISDG